MSKCFQIWGHFFPLLFTKGSKNLKSLHIGLLEVGEKGPLNRVRNTDSKKMLLSKAKFGWKLFFFAGQFTPFISKSFQIWDHFFPLLFPKDSKNLTLGSGGKRCLNGTSKSEHTDGHTWTLWLIESIGSEGRYYEKRT